MSLKVENVLKVYETDGEEHKGINYPTISVKNHWAITERVVLVIENKKYTVLARDLQKAITNATNT